MSIPAPKTQAQAAEEDAPRLRAEYEANPQRALALAILESLGTQHNPLPVHGSQDDVERRAHADFRTNDFSDAYTYIDSLVKIADHYQSLAEDYHQWLESHGAIFSSMGHVERFTPFAVIDGGRWIGGSAEVFDLADPDDRPGAAEYLRAYLPTQQNKAIRLRCAEAIAKIEEEK